MLARLQSGIRRFKWYDFSSRYRFEHRLAKEVLKTIPRDGLDRIQQKYRTQAPGKEGSIINHSKTTKYLDAQRWVDKAVHRATILGLQNSKPLKILDLGCGACWFLAVARHLGHEVIGLDLGDNNMYNDVIDLIKMERVDHCIKPYEPLPEFDKQFDVITAYMIYFNWSGRSEAWDADEWIYFLDDCRSKLTDCGRIRLELNPGRHRDRYRFLPDETAKKLRLYPGAKISENKKTIIVSKQQQ